MRSIGSNSKENSGIPTGDFQLEEEIKALGGSMLCSSSPEHNSKLRLSFLSPVMEIYRGKNSEVERLLSPESDMCSWHMGVLHLCIGRVQPLQVPTWSGIDSLFKAIWICVLWEKSFDNIIFTGFPKLRECDRCLNSRYNILFPLQTPQDH